MLIEARDEHGEALHDSVLRDELLTMFIAGHETTALTLTWLFTLLDGRSDVVERMREEVDQKLGARAPSFQDLAELSYLRQVIDETLRLRPPAPLIARNTHADDVITGYPIRAGEVVMPFLWATHRHPDFWPAPERFDPDRFQPARAEKRHSYSYIPFSAGPRVCIGNMFSLVETTILLAQLLQRFEITVLPCAHVKPIAMTTARPSAPVHVELRARR
jgi:cytochrome P450